MNVIFTFLPYSFMQILAQSLAQVTLLRNIGSITFNDHGTRPRRAAATRTRYLRPHVNEPDSPTGGGLLLICQCSWAAWLAEKVLDPLGWQGLQLFLGHVNKAVQLNLSFQDI